MHPGGRFHRTLFLLGLPNRYDPQQDSRYDVFRAAVRVAFADQEDRPDQETPDRD